MAEKPDSPAAASDSVPSNKATPDFPSPDKPFIVRMLASCELVIDASQLAGGRASKPVAAYAGRLGEQRTQTRAQLQKVADRHDIHPPREQTLAAKSVLSRLTRLDGRDFDQAYLEAIVDRQQDELALYKRQIDYGVDGALKAFAQQAIPALQKDLKQAHHLLEHAAASTTQPIKPSSDEGSMMMMK